MSCQIYSQNSSSTVQYSSKRGYSNKQGSSCGCPRCSICIYGKSGGLYHRGSIVTPLKDRIDSQIITHYPKKIIVGKKITQRGPIGVRSAASSTVFELVKDLVEQIALTRESEYIDAKSGVSARLTISAYENLISAAERRMIKNGMEKTTVRVTDFVRVIPGITGKVELVYEGEQEGPGTVAANLISKAIRVQFLNFSQILRRLEK